MHGLRIVWVAVLLLPGACTGDGQPSQRPPEPAAPAAADAAAKRLIQKADTVQPAKVADERPKGDPVVAPVVGLTPAPRVSEGSQDPLGPVDTFSGLPATDVLQVRFDSTGCFGSQVYEFEFRTGKVPSVSVLAVDFEAAGHPQQTREKRVALGTVQLSPADVEGLDGLLAFYRKRFPEGCTNTDHIAMKQVRDGKTVAKEEFVDETCAAETGGEYPLGTTGAAVRPQRRNLTLDKLVDRVRHPDAADPKEPAEGGPDFRIVGAWSPGEAAAPGESDERLLLLQDRNHKEAYRVVLFSMSQAKQLWSVASDGRWPLAARSFPAGILVTKEEGLALLDQATGKELWTMPGDFRGVGFETDALGRCAVIRRNGEVVAIDLATGKWFGPVPAERALVGGDWVVIGDNQLGQKASHLRSCKSGEVARSWKGLTTNFFQVGDRLIASGVEIRVRFFDLWLSAADGSDAAAPKGLEDAASARCMGQSMDAAFFLKGDGDEWRTWTWYPQTGRVVTAVGKLPPEFYPAASLATSVGGKFQYVGSDVAVAASMGSLFFWTTTGKVAAFGVDTTTSTPRVHRVADSLIAVYRTDSRESVTAAVRFNAATLAAEAEIKSMGFAQLHAGPGGICVTTPGGSQAGIIDTVRMMWVEKAQVSTWDRAAGRNVAVNLLYCARDAVVLGPVDGRIVAIVRETGVEAWHYPKTGTAP